MKIYFDFLEALRKGGKTNTLDAVQSLEKEFNLTPSDARYVLLKWMQAKK